MGRVVIAVVGREGGEEGGWSWRVSDMVGTLMNCCDAVSVLMSPFLFPLPTMSLATYTDF